MAADTTNDRPKRVLTAEQKRKMAEGRERAQRARAAEVARAAADEAEHARSQPGGNGAGTKVATGLDAIAEKHIRTTPAEVRETQARTKRGSNGRDEEMRAQEQRGAAIRDADVRGSDLDHRDDDDRDGEQDEDDDEDQEYPSVAELGQRVKLYSPGTDAIPPPEQDPRMRDGMTVEIPDLTGDKRQLHTLEDIFGTYPIGDGQYFITVDRKHPKFWGQINCSGMQKNITRHMTREEFAGAYGGGEYVLIVHGPPKRGAGIIDPQTHRARTKPLSEPIKVTVSMDVSSPNLQSMLEDDSYEEDPMLYAKPGTIGPGFSRANGAGRPATPADAQIHRAELDHEDRRWQRERELEKEREERERELKLEAERRGMTAQQLLAERADREAERLAAAHEREMAMIRGQHDRELRMMREQMGRPTETSQLGEAIAQIAAVMKPSGPSPELTQAQAQQQQQYIAQLTDGFKRDLERIDNTHRGEMKRMEQALTDARTAADARVKEITDRCDKQIRDAEDRAAKRVNDVETLAAKQLSDAKESAQKQVTDADQRAQRAIDDIRQQSQQRLDDERRNHERDLKSQELATTTRLETQKSTYEMRISSIGEEITRLRTENDRLRRENDKARDLPARIQEFEATAEAMGLSRDGGKDDEMPTDWKSMLFLIAREVAPQLGDLARGAADAVRAARQPIDPNQAAAIQAQQYAEMQAGAQHTAPAGMMGGPGPLAFATEDGPDFTSDDEPAPMPRFPQQQVPGAFQTPPVAPPGPAVQQTQQQAPVAPPASMVPQGQPAPAPAQPPRPRPAPAPRIPVSDQQILGFTPTLQAAFEQGADPEDVAREIVSQTGKELAAGILVSVSPQMIGKVLQKQQGGARNPLVRREGQKFLADIWAAMKKLVGG